MKRITHRRIAIIEERTAGLFEAAINAKLDELADYEPELIIESIATHTAYLRYRFDEYLPESMADKFELLGVQYHCRDCAYCEFKKNRDGSINKTTKKAWCEQEHRQIYFEMPACDTFYFELTSRTGQFREGADLPADAQQLLTDNKI